jgi:RNA polymerase sigma-70 factor (ECF subfamily)
MTGHEAIRGALVNLLPDLRAYARFLHRDATRADDLVQETVLRALAASAQFQPGTSPKAWLFTIQRNTFLQRTRAAKREDLAMRRHADGTQEPAQAHGQDIADLQAMLWTLPPSLREALLLVGAQELSHEEAAAICGVPAGTMRARVSRARAQLARAYAPDQPSAAKQQPSDDLRPSDD